MTRLNIGKAASELRCYEVDSLFVHWERRLTELIKKLSQAIENSELRQPSGEPRTLKYYVESGMDVRGDHGAGALVEEAVRRVLAQIEAAGFVLMPKSLAPLGLNVPGVPHPIYMLPPAKSARQSAIALSLAKAGSTMFFNIIDDICRASDLTYVNFTNSYFVYGVDPARLPQDEGRMYQPYGYCYGGFRSIPIGYTAPAIRGMKKMLLVRDMRDILVSRYFSGTYTHPLPGVDLDGRYRSIFLAEREMLISKGIDAGVLALAPEYRTFWDRYQQEMTRDTFHVWRYEDVVFEKGKLAREICDFLGIVLEKNVVAEIVEKQDVFPKRERKAFIRRVKPGDYKNKLSPHVITQIDEMFADYQEQFGYRPATAGRRRKRW